MWDSVVGTCCRYVQVYPASFLQAGHRACSWLRDTVSVAIMYVQMLTQHFSCGQGTVLAAGIESQRLLCSHVCMLLPGQSKI